MGEDGEMILEEVNPLALSLDDVIKLNKLRNQARESNGFVNDDEETFTPANCDTLMKDNLSSQRKLAIHERLGYKNKFFRTNQDYALRAIRNARMNTRKRQFGFRGGFNNNLNNSDSQVMPPPLTAQVLRRHNAKGNFTVIRAHKAPSVSSVSTKSFRQPFRHSLKKCLDMNIQNTIRNLMADGNAGTLMHNDHRFPDDLRTLQEFRVIATCSAMPTYVRFNLNN